MPHLHIPAKLLVIAQSARMIAQLVVDAGFLPVVVDCFADADTRQLALDVIKVGGLSLDEVRPAVEVLRKAHGLTHAVYGSGFEHYAETLAFLEEDWVVLGNSVTVFRQFQDKQVFFRQLALLAIPYPGTVFVPPGDSGGWLFKPMQGEGGINICSYASDSAIDAGRGYWQRQMPGVAMSLTFVAGSGKFRLLGFNRQWHVAIDS